METVYDWLTVAIFAGLILLFLQRSAAPEPPEDSVWHYLPAAGGCAGANYLGNEGNDLLAILMIIGVLAYTALILKPFDRVGS